MDLLEFLASFDGKPMQWGVDDCTAVQAMWVSKRKGVQIEIPFYETKEEAHAIIASYGGLVNIYDEFLFPLGIPETASPKYGDIAVVQMSDTQVGMVFANHGIGYWRREDAAGFHQLRPRPRWIVKAWSLQ